ncbi:MAG: metallophosphoesterase family protein [Oscillochloris sp.]|nr:metallophosphoesterase family protein [Oscillochloris sp.]
MRIAVLADIHSNLIALEAVVADIEAWSPDIVIVAGDVVNRGPDARDCLLRILQLRAERGWRVIRGNHEGYVLRYDRDHRLPEFATAGPRRDMANMTVWTHGQLIDLIAEIAALPEELRLDLPQGPLVIYHASIRHNRDGINRNTAPDLLRAQIDPAAAVFCVGHTHVPLITQIDRTLVVNCGSVGLSFDGDTRPAYARLRLMDGRWQAQIRRVNYNLAAAQERYRASGMLEMVGPIGSLMLRELQTAHSYIFDFVPAYRDKVLSGVISLSEAVEDFLHSYHRAA